jgi:transglutaminase-like putative cysteine protease
MQEKLSFGIGLPSYEFQDFHGNMTCRATLMPGSNEIRHDAFVAVSSLPESREVRGEITPVGQLPCELLRYTLPSRYCDSDKLLDFAWQRFGQIPHGLPRVQAICDWVHQNIEYRTLSGRPDLSASEVIARRYGVCRDFAHATIALCRAFNLPARYVTGHLPDIGCFDPGSPMDFHAYCEVYLGQEWLTFDARFNVPRIGRVKVAHGSDAVDGAFATIYGEAKLTHFEVWAYQVNPQEVSIGDPIDLSKRLDGNPTVRLN